MMPIHCHACGGFIGELGSISYRLPPAAAPPAAPRSGLCTCGGAIVYGPPPGHSSSPGMPAVSPPPLASRRV